MAKGAEIVAPDAPSRDGYVFLGWDTEFSYASEDLTITALYEPIEYFTVRFIDFDGTILSEQSITKGLPATPPTNPTREGYTFIGWDKEFTSITENVDINAVYQINTYLVRFFDWDGQLLKQQNVEYKSAATPPADPTRTGYTFIGWDKDFSNVTEDMTITAQYEINRYKVDFFDWDGELLKTDSVTYLYPAVPPADPERTGYTFTGWDKTVNEVVQDTTITALYDINYYLVVLISYDGTLLSEQNIAYNHAAEAPEVPEREGYIFSRWSSDIEHIVKQTYATPLYDKIGGTVIYKSEDGEIIGSENVDLHLPEAPVIPGKSFAGWLTESADSGYGIVLRATYTSDNPNAHDDVTVIPSSNSANVTFPFITGALTYGLVIRDLFGIVVCKLMFSSTGHLLGIAFAPSRNRTQQQQASQSTGFNFTVEGLTSSTTYEYDFTANDETDDVIETLSGSFTTTAEIPTSNEIIDSQSSNRKYIEDGLLFIDNNDRTYDARGQQVK